MKFNTITRIASLVLAFGFLFSCTATESQLGNSIEYFEEENYQEALESVDSVIDEDPQNADAHYYRGRIHYRLAEEETSAAARHELYSEMRSSYNEALSLYSEQGRSRYSDEIKNDISFSWKNELETGVEIMEDVGDSETAILHLENAILIKPDNIDSYKYASEAYLAQDDPGRAFEILDSGVSNSGEVSTETLEQHAYLALQSGSYIIAYESFKKLEDTESDNLNLAHGLVNSLKQVGEHQKAAEILSSLIETAPDNPDYMLSYAKQLYEISLSYFGDWIEVYRDAPSSDETETLFEKARDSAKKAESKFENALELAPQAEEAISSFAIFSQNMAAELSDIYSGVANEEYQQQLQEMIDYYAENAIESYESIVETSDDPAYYWESLFQLYTFTDQQDKAEDLREEFE